MPETIFIVREANVLNNDDLTAPTTVWACPGTSDAYSETGTKIAGPIPGLFADKMVKGLASLLERLGHAVVIEDTADD